jgi:hypothetical protein
LPISGRTTVMSGGYGVTIDAAGESRDMIRLVFA